MNTEYFMNGWQKIFLYSQGQRYSYRNKKRNSIRIFSLENDDRTVDIDELLGEKMSKTLDIVGFSEIHRIIVSKH